MTETLVERETALLAKELGFDWRKSSSWAYLNPNGMAMSYDEESCVLIPTQTLLHDYLIEKHGYYIVVIPTVTSHWTFKSVKVISEVDNDVISGLISVSDLPPYKEVNGTDYSTHTQALEAGLQEVLKQIKTK